MSCTTRTFKIIRKAKKLKCVETSDFHVFVRKVQWRRSYSRLLHYKGYKPGAVNRRAASMLRVGMPHRKFRPGAMTS
eukprot:scaffold93362_cov48-Prasinocladus_malaysianus.AAC.2